MSPPTVERTELAGWALSGVGPEELASRLAGAVAALRAGRAVLHPTETVYGVGSDLSGAGVRAVLAAKERPDTRPLLALIPGVEAATDLEWTDEAREFARTFWPGAVTLVLRDPRGRFPAGVRSPGGTVAVRHSPHPIAGALVEALGAPMTSSSANRPGEAPARGSEEAGRFARWLAERSEPGSGAPHWIDAGSLPERPPSTLIDCTGATPRVLREGAVPIGRLRCVLPGIER